MAKHRQQRPTRMPLKPRRSRRAETAYRMLSRRAALGEAAAQRALVGVDARLQRGEGFDRALDTRSPKKSSAVIAVNPGDADWTRQKFVLWFGAYGTTRLLVWANSLDRALDEAIDWLVDNAPGHIVDDQVNETYNEAIADGADEDEARERAEEDTTSGGNAGNHIMSSEWGIEAENPSRLRLFNMRKGHR